MFDRLFSPRSPKPYGIRAKTRLCIEQLEARDCPSTAPQVGIYNPGDQSSLAGDMVSMGLSGWDSDGNPLTYSASGLPAGLSLDSSNGGITGTIPPHAYQATPFAVTVTATYEGVSASQTFQWTVNPPLVWIYNPGDQASLAGDVVSTGLSGWDSDSDPLTYSASGLPAGLSLDSSNGGITGTIPPHAYQATPFAVTITATDGLANISASQTFQWTVSPPLVGISNPGDQASLAGDVVSTGLSGWDSDSDPLTYSASGLPAGLSLDSSNGGITGTIPPHAYQATPFAVTITATDGLANISASQTFQWTVSPPLVGISNPGDQANLAGDTVCMGLVGWDSDGDPLTYAASGLPAGLSLDSSNGGITGTIPPHAYQATPFAVTITATDGLANISASQTFQWTVSPPLVGISNPGDQANLTSDSVCVSLTAWDSAGDALTYSAFGLPDGLSIDSNSGVISGTLPDAVPPDTLYAVTIIATDSAANISASQNFNWTINQAVVAPQITLNAQIWSGHEVQLTGTVTDNDPAGVTVTFAGAVSGSTVTDGDGNFTFITEAAVAGTVTAAGVDQDQQSTNTASADITPVAPVLTLTLSSLTANTVTLSGTVTDLDPAGETVTINGVANDSVLTDANGNFLFTTSLADLGAIDAAATDLWGLTSNTAEVDVTSLPTTNSPQLTLTALVLPGHEVQLSGTLTGSQPAGATVTFSGAASGTATTDAAGHFSFTTTNASLGTVQAVATDLAQQSSNTADATIAETSPNLTLAISSSANGTATLTGKLTDIDMAGQTISIGGALTSTVVTDANGNFSFTAPASTAGTINVSKTDLWGETSNVAAVTMPTNPPVIRNFGIICELGLMYTFQGRVLGANVTGLTVRFGGLPSLVGRTARVYADGWFHLTLMLTANDRIGTATAQVTDQFGRTSNLAFRTMC